MHLFFLLLLLPSFFIPKSSQFLLTFVVARKVKYSNNKLTEIKGKKDWLKIRRSIVANFKVLNKDIGREEPYNVDNEAEEKGPILQLKHFGGLVRDDAQQFLLLNRKIMIYFFNYLLLVVEKRTDLLSLS